MHLILPFAAAQSDTGRHALQTLRLPQLDALLPRLTLSLRDEGDELSLTTPHERLAELPTASLARVIGGNIDRWLPASSQARLIGRLQSEAQMLLYRHPVNEEREAHRELPVNSFWLSGCGVRQPSAQPADLRV